MNKSSWMTKIEKAEKFSEKAVMHGKKVYKLYKDDRDEEGILLKKANFFYSNVSILKESLYNSPPKPDVGRVQRGNFTDDAARVAALIVQRGLAYEIECMPHFEEAISMAILDRLVPGIGQVWFRFEMKKNEDGTAVDGSEQIHIDHVQWCDFLYGPAKKWSAVPWVARRLHLTKEEIEKKWGSDAMALVGAGTEGSSYETEAQKQLNVDTFEVYEIWDKKSKKIIYQAKGGAKPLEMKDDPYSLKNFFPCPRPLIANVTTEEFLPVTDYHLAQDQYNVLNTLYARINLIVKAIKVAGIYNSASMDITRMLTSAENVLIPVDNWAMMAENGGVSGNIEWFPVEQVAQVLQHLNGQFEAAKSMLYEITGMSDIIRGASNQYETAQAQQIKAQFASVRMNGYQRDVAIFVRDSLRITAEMMTQLYSDKKMIAIVGDLPEPDRQFLPAAAEILRDDFISQYKVSIQADSLTQADWALEKKQKMELVQTLGQMIAAVSQGAAQTPELAVLGVNMIKFAISGYKGATEFEGYIDSTLDSMLEEMQKAKQNPQPKPPSPEEQKAQGEMQKLQMEGQMKQQEFQMEQQAAQMQLQMDQQKMEMEMAMKQRESAMNMEMEERRAQIELTMKQAELQHQTQMFELELQIEMVKLQLEQEKARMGLVVDAAKAQQGLEVSKAQGEQKLEQQKASAKASEAKPSKEK